EISPSGARLACLWGLRFEALEAFVLGLRISSRNLPSVVRRSLPLPGGLARRSGDILERERNYDLRHEPACGAGRSDRLCFSFRNFWRQTALAYTLFTQE